MITTNRLREVMDYNPVTGVFTWKVSLGKAKKGKECGRVFNNGYRMIRIDGKTYLAHRLAWFYVTGKWPAHELDHINRNREDNRLQNLREATKSQNQHNRGMQANNTSGHKGVWWAKRRNRWRADIYLHGVKYYVGSFTSKEQADEAYKNAAEKMHGIFGLGAGP